MKTLQIDFDRTNFELLISWFESIGYPCQERGLHTAQGQYWYVDILYQHFSVQIYDEKLYIISSLKWT